MGKNSKIEWTDHTANLWWGCTKVHRGCDNCYAEAWSNRWDNKLWGNDAPRKYIKSVWGNLAKWQAEAESEGVMRRVFVGSMMDIFEKPMPLVDSKGQPVTKLPGDWLHSLVDHTTENARNFFFNEIVPACPNLMFLLLTKRPSNINKYIPKSWLNNQPENVMYGASVVDQKSANDVARAFAKVNGTKFLSIEPLLKEISMEPFELYNDYPMSTIDWVIVGGESGTKRRDFNPNWARKIHDWVKTCNYYASPEDEQKENWPTAFFMKQWDKIKEVPEDLMVREFPVCHALKPQPA